MTNNRVVITGMGVISPLGNSIKKYWESISNGFNGISPITLFDTSNYQVHIGGEANIKLESYLDSKTLNRIDKFTAFALIAAEQALKSSKIDVSKINTNRAGVIVSSGIGGMNTFEKQHSKLLKDPKKVSPFFIPSMIPDIASGYISIKYNFKGTNYAILSACSSSAHSIGESYRNIKHGYSDIIISGGAEASITPMSIAGFSNMKALSKNSNHKTASRPFDKKRDGFVISEGAGILLLEELQHAINRKATIYAEIKGFGASADAYHITTPHPKSHGAIQSMQQAINEARLKTNDIQYINAHGTSTYHNDIIETNAIKKVFKKSSKNLHVSSTKSMIGHSLGASGALEAIATILSIKNSTITPTINYKNIDPLCDLNYVPNESIVKKIDNALSNSFGFGGHNATLTLSKYNEKD